jgi:hemoglobin
MTLTQRTIRPAAMGLLLWACLSWAGPWALAEEPRERSLYERLGGAAVIAAVVEETVETMAADPRVNQSFDKVDLKRLKKMIVELMCALTGGPCSYGGDDMKTTHAGLDITEAEFYALVEAERAALDHHRVGTREKNELLRLLAPMKRDIVTK